MASNDAGCSGNRISSAASVVALAKIPSESMISRSVRCRCTCLASGSSVESDSISATLQQLLDIGRDILGLGRGGVAFDLLPVASDQELGEVPLAAFSAEEPRRLL